MQIITINEQKFLHEHEPLKVARNYESTVYVLGDELYKILNLPYDILDSGNREYSRFLKYRENNVVELMRLNPNGGCNPKALLISEKYFLGCVYPYLNGYDELLVKHYPIEIRAELCRKLNEIFREFWKLNIQYTDLSLHNVMTDGKDIKFVDMDSISMNNFQTYGEEERFLIFTCQQLAILSLSILLDLDIDGLNISNYNLLKSLTKVLDNKELINILAYSLETKFAYKPYFVDRVLDKVDLEKLDDRVKSFSIKR